MMKSANNRQEMIPECRFTQTPIQLCTNWYVKDLCPHLIMISVLFIVRPGKENITLSFCMYDQRMDQDWVIEKFLQKDTKKVFVCSIEFRIPYTVNLYTLWEISPFLSRFSKPILFLI